MPLPAAAVAALPAVGSLVGGIIGNRSRSQEAAKNRRFQERMRNTEWQAGVEDMKRAGINPALAYSQGGASSPSGSMASQDDVVSPAISSGMQGKRLSEEIANMRAVRDNTRAQTMKTQAETKVVEGNVRQLFGPLVGRGVEGLENMMQNIDLAGTGRAVRDAAGAAGRWYTAPARRALEIYKKPAEAARDWIVDRTPRIGRWIRGFRQR